jgi:hypothetical protein
MRNFFLLPPRFRNFTIDRTLKNLTGISLLAIVLSFTGCKTAQPVEESYPEPKKNIEEHLKNAEAVKSSLIKQLEHPKSVDETIMIKDHLGKLQDEIDLLKTGKDAPLPTTDEDEGFKSVKEKKTYYGPVGWTVEVTQWILEKLWIMHET